MKGQRLLIAVALLALLLASAAGLTLAQGPEPPGGDTSQAVLGTSFTYQGRLENASGPVTSSCDFQFSLWDAAGSGSPPTGGTQIGTTQTKTNVSVSEGLFTVELDFGNIFYGDARWLQIAVRCPAGSGTYSTLSPRQPLTATPYALSLRPGAAIHSWTASQAGLTLLSDTGVGLVVSSAGDNGVSVWSAGNEGVNVTQAGGKGVAVWSAGEEGVYVDTAGGDGVYVREAGNASTTYTNADKNGFEVAGAQGHGLFVGRADREGVYVLSAGQYGLLVSAAGQDGVQVSTAGLDGLAVYTAGDDGVYVNQAGSPSTTNTSADKNGFEVAGAQGHGLWVGRANLDGVMVYSAGDDGVYVASAGDIGVYANTTQASHEWGFYTPDKIYAGTALASGGPVMLVAQSGGGGNLEPGDVVAVSGTGAVLGESESPTPLVQRANPDGRAVMGVVYSRLVVEKEVNEVERDGQVERQTSLRTRSAQGPIAPGDYLLVVVLGPAQVKVAGAGLRPGDLLTMAPNGQATKATPIKVGETTFYAPGTVIGQAMGALDPTQSTGLVWVLVMPR